MSLDQPQQSPGPAWPRFQEPVRRTLTRNLAIAGVIAAGWALATGRPRLVFPLVILASWFSLGGHYVEVAFLNGLRPRIAPRRVVQVVVRVLVWMASGILLYLCMVATAHLLPFRPPALRLWWYGAVLLIGIELLAHAALAIRGRPNFYNGRG